ncbi:prophage tail fiber N-terminal domain-containing protein, partial [Escherichia coli]|nr:prophage tail fiber N-terminal domain-containing protein [Escherichia coli]
MTSCSAGCVQRSPDTKHTQRLSEIGVIRVYEDSTDGSLNDFLGATDIDLRPEALKKFEELAQQAQQ